MPSIEITPAQARALARGDNITIKPESKSKRYLAIFLDTENIFRFESDRGEQCYVPRAVTLNGATLVGKGAHGSPLGFVQRSAAGTAIVVPLKRTTSRDAH